MKHLKVVLRAEAVDQFCLRFGFKGLLKGSWALCYFRPKAPKILLVGEGQHGFGGCLDEGSLWWAYSLSRFRGLGFTHTPHK